MSDEHSERCVGCFLGIEHADEMEKVTLGAPAREDWEKLRATLETETQRRERAEARLRELVEEMEYVYRVARCGVTPDEKRILAALAAAKEEE